ncbi:MAG: NAD-dependent epimerase/dehydratase family protein, partial [Planctomycetota bacterium]
MKIVIPGGSGHVGQLLARHFVNSGEEVLVLSRGDYTGAGRGVRWDGKTLDDWASEIDGADVVINLAGRTVDCRYNATNRRQIMDSRVDSTRLVGEAIAKASNPPAVWLQMSTATIYAHTLGPAHDEASRNFGGTEPDVSDTWNFSIDVASNWEAAATQADTPDTRLVLLRSAMVMQPDDGSVFRVLSRLVRLGLGGSVGGGRQFVSWMHGDDFARAIRHIIDTNCRPPPTLPPRPR